MPTPDPILSTDLAGIPLRTPVMLAAGTAGTLDEMADVLDLSHIGAIVTKSITPEPREGNQTWRILPTDAGMLNALWGWCRLDCGHWPVAMNCKRIHFWSMCGLFIGSHRPCSGCSRLGKRQPHGRTTGVVQ